MLEQILTSKEAIAVYALILAGLDKKFQFIKPIVKYAENHKRAVKTAEHVLEDGMNAVLHSPEVVALKTKADKLEKDVEKSDIYKAATAVLHNLSVKVEDLTPEMINVVGLTISNQVYRLFGKKVSVKDVIAILDEFKTLATDVASQQGVKSTEEVIAPPNNDNSTPDSPVDNGQATQAAVN